MFKTSLYLIFLLFLMPVSQALPWGSVEYWAPTHQIILTEAYKLLIKDPAFQGSGFLPFESILSNEGVVAKGDMFLDFEGKGDGPDADDASLYSYHYYNPITRQGMADFAVLTYYKQFIDPLNYNDKSKAAAWSAHFLADMSVPYHVVGMTSDDAIAYKNENTGELSEEITGPLFLYDNNAAGLQPPVGWGGRNYFLNAIVNFVDDHSGGYVDWFDPWYSNGSGLRNSHEVATSSHVLWEGDAHKKYLKYPFVGWLPNEEGWYNLAWKNAVHNFNFNKSVTVAQSEQAAVFTQSVALFTRKNIQDIHLNPQVGIYNAIKNVATLWRASITGLRPSIHYTFPKDPKGSPLLECRVRNAADSIADNVRVKLFIQQKTKLIHEQVKSIGSIFPGGTGSAKYRLLLEPDTEYLIGMAIAAKYDIPDLQYATVSGMLKTKPAEIIDPVPPVIIKKPVKGIQGLWKTQRGTLGWESMQVVHVKDNYYECRIVKLLPISKKEGYIEGELAVKFWRIGNTNKFKIQKIQIVKKNGKNTRKWRTFGEVEYFPEKDMLGQFKRIE